MMMAKPKRIQRHEVCEKSLSRNARAVMKKRTFSICPRRKMHHLPYTKDRVRALITRTCS